VSGDRRQAGVQRNVSVECAGGGGGGGTHTVGGGGSSGAYEGGSMRGVVEILLAEAEGIVEKK